ncbi:DUF2642 domain-containing protein [Priestia aryabhattai]|uniref:DUF2642 domain-containing protein n=1 Tax=Priestia aryabhattai TaxID=412384 RepID=A0ABD7X3N8_PRIAR|nr:DUF2642 domain-containing protein [Priestia aryabhattai]WEA47261.1 DUF2642 domain-containing protein [Priestia aryabhattai]
MALSSEKRAELLRRLNALTQNLTNTTDASTATGGDLLDLNLPGLSLDIDLPNLGSLFPSTPNSIRSLLSSLVGKQVVIATPYDPQLSGTVLSVESDYVVLVETDGSLDYVNISKIETVTAL